MKKMESKKHGSISGIGVRLTLLHKLRELFQLSSLMKTVLATKAVSTQPALTCTAGPMEVSGGQTQLVY